MFGEQGWHSGESTRLPPMWSGFKFQRQRHMWVEFVVGSPGIPVFPSPQKPTLPNISNTRTCLNKFIRTPECFVSKQITI